MNLSQLHDLFDSKPGMREAVFEGKCHDCGEDVSITVRIIHSDTVPNFEVSGGAVFQPFVYNPDRRFVKCRGCFDLNPHLNNFQECEVYCRCIGYLRPVSQMNEGKRAEVKDRKMFSLAP